MRRRSPSYTPPPRRGSRRSPSPRRRYPARRDPPTSLLVRNLAKDCRSDDLRGPFGRFGPIRDVYLPTDYYSGEPRGFGFVQYLDPIDAEEAQYYMNHQILHGREITVVFAQENRKRPAEMRSKERIRGRSSDGRHYSPYYGQSRSRSPRYRSRSPRGRHYSRSQSPDRRRARERSYTESPERSPSPSRYTHKARHEQSQSEGKRASPDRDPYEKSSGRDQLRYSKSPPRSPSLPPRRRRPSQSQQSPSKTRNDDQLLDEGASPALLPQDN